MPFSRPKLTTLVQQASQDITAATIGADGFLRRAVLSILGKVVAGFAWEHYAYQDFTAQQSTPFTATEEFADGWGNLKGVPRKAATAAILQATFTGNTGVQLPIGTVVNRQDGFSYTLTASEPVGATTAGICNVTLLANVAGSNGTADAGTQLVLANGYTGITANSGIVVSGSAGSDVETDAAYKTRYLQVYANPPQGGALSDYMEWAEAVGGVTRAWVMPYGAGAGTVIVFTMFDIVRSAQGGFPQGTNGVATNEPRDPVHIAAGDQLLVANYIYPLRPVTALVYSSAPENAPVNFTISDLGTANTTANQTAITTALQDMFIRLSNVGGTINPATNAPWPNIDPEAWYEAISSVIGTGSANVTTPSAPLVAGTGQLFTLGTITFTS